MSQGAVTIDPVIMLNAAQSVDAQRSIIENCLRNILSDAKSLKSIWEGESATAYQAAIAKIEENSPGLVSVIQEYVLDLNAIANNIIKTDREAAAASAALPSGVFGSD